MPIPKAAARAPRRTIISKIESSEVEVTLTESKRRWLDAGLALLAERGHTELNIANLSQVVGKTIGSFYHQFDGIEDYIAMLALMRLHHSRDLLARIEREEPQPLARLHRLGRESKKHYGWKLGEALAVWRDGNERVRVASEEHVKIVRQFLVRCFEDLGFDPEEALLRAQMLQLVNSSYIRPELRTTVFRQKAFELLLSARGAPAAKSPGPLAAAKPRRPRAGMRRSA